MSSWSTIPLEVLGKSVLFLEAQREELEDEEWKETLRNASLVCRHWRQCVVSNIQTCCPRLRIDELGKVPSLLPNLRSLDLGKCRPWMEQTWDAVADFRMERSSFSGLNWLSSLTKLRELRVRHIDDSALKIICEMDMLEQIGLGGYLTITENGVQHLRKLKRLQRLRLDPDGLIQSKSYCFLSSLLRLERLELYNCTIDDLALEFLSDLTELKEITLFLCHKVTGDGFVHFSRLSKLRSLDLGASGVREDRLEYLKPCTALRYLNLSFCRIFGVLEGLSSLPLERLQLLRCECLTTERVFELKGKMKKCTIIYQKSGDVLMEPILTLK